MQSSKKLAVSPLYCDDKMLVAIYFVTTAEKQQHSIRSKKIQRKLIKITKLNWTFLPMSKRQAHGDHSYSLS
jgi:hypothetical protein